MPFFNSKLLPLMLLLWLSNTGAQSVADIQPPATPVSMIEIPLRLHLEPLIDAAEKALPTQAGNWRNWKNWHGIKSKYRAWRGPLHITASGDVLTVQAHIRYWIRARKNLLGAITLKGNCGINEPPRQAVIGMQVHLGWEADWTLKPEFHILPTRFLDRCEMTIANIDVTPLREGVPQANAKQPACCTTETGSRHAGHPAADTAQLVIIAGSGNTRTG